MPESVDATLAQGPVPLALKRSLQSYIPSNAPVCVAFSGGVDSTVLLHALARSGGARMVRAVYVDHGLHADSGTWAKQCVQTGRELQVPVTVCAATIDRTAGIGLEAAAREARYAVLAEQLEPGEVLLTAHHRRDQFETVLLRLMRGTGVHGMAAMSAYSHRGAMAVLRPLLDVSAEDIRAYAHAAGLGWIEDPSNTDRSLDRNFLRHEVLPALLERWPSAEIAVARAARLSAGAAEILDDVARQDLDGVLEGNRIWLPGLSKLTAPRQLSALRYALHARTLPLPSEQQLRQALNSLVQAGEDTQPEAAWPGVRIRRYRQHLWLYAQDADPRCAIVPAEVYSWVPGDVLQLGAVRGTLRGERAIGRGIAAGHCELPLEVRFREGGERLRIARNGRTQELKNLLQEMGVVPWMRGHIPLLYSGSQLLAVADLWVNADFAAGADATGINVKWEHHSPVR